MTISLGKVRRLQQTSTSRGVFNILAIDHRGPLRLALSKMAEVRDVEQELATLKVDIVRELAPGCSAVLLDPEVGLEAAIVRGALPGSTGLLNALDTGSSGDPANPRTGLVDGWSADHMITAGVSGLKLLVYYHPESPEAFHVETLVRQVGIDCSRLDLPFFLEPLSYDPRQPSRPLPSAERRKVVMETAHRLTDLGVDILKAEFPLNPAESTDEAEWADACAELTAKSRVPWALLSAGVSWDVFLRQAEVACRAGASGVIAGRAVWKEAVVADRAARLAHLRGAAQERLRQVGELCAALGRPWWSWAGLAAPQVP